MSASLPIIEQLLSYPRAQRIFICSACIIILFIQGRSYRDLIEGADIIIIMIVIVII